MNSDESIQVEIFAVIMRPSAHNIASLNLENFSCIYAFSWIS